MIRLRSMALLMGVACTLGLFTFEARGGPLTITVQETGGLPITIQDGGALDLDMAEVGVILVNTTLLNANPELANYRFAALGANSNSPGDATDGFLSQNATVQLRLGGTGSVTVIASDNAYQFPNGATRTMQSSASSTYTSATAGNTEVFTSWFNPNSVVGAKQIASGDVTNTSSAVNPNSQSGDAPPTTPLPLTNPYGLTNQMVITLTGGSAGALAQNQYAGATAVIAATIPEPASMTLMLGVLPVLVFGMRRRKAA